MKNESKSAFKVIEKKLLWGFFVVWIIISGPGLFNYLYNLIEPIDISNIKSHQGVASIQYLGSLGRTRSKTLVIGDKYYSCRIDISNATKGCSGIPQDYIQSEVVVEYISMRWNPASTSNNHPIRISRLESDHSVLLVDDTAKLVKLCLLSDLKSSIVTLIICIFLILIIIKFIRYVERKSNGKTR